jgi:cytoskeleton protein RodZ
MTAIGETLRRERVRRNLDLDQISRQTKISVRFLELIEAEQFERLPGGVFTKSFVRQYARALGLDEDEIVAELQRVLQPPEPDITGDTDEPEPRIQAARIGRWQGADSESRSSSSLPSLALVVAVMLLCSGIYAVWQKARRPAPAAAAAEPSASISPVALAERSADAPGEGSGQPAPAGPTALAQQVEPAQQAGPAVELGTPGGAVQVVLNAEEETWIEAWADDRRVIFDTLQPTQTRAIRAAKEVRLLLGNAGGLAITLNGNRLDPVGTKGQVRLLRLTAEGVQTVPRKPPLPDDVL